MTSKAFFDDKRKEKKERKKLGKLKGKPDTKCRKRRFFPIILITL